MTIVTSVHLLAQEDDEFKPEVEDIGKESIRICMSSGKQRVILTLGERQALHLSHIIDTYFQDKNT